ncbi:hypothetical protein BY458DRAFT_529085 [Sporodiniella umbellata]|nr:hypothetical protein BY458DRAFT_529085 [Sporodiniella umbellata]
MSDMWKDPFGLNLIKGKKTVVVETCKKTKKKEGKPCPPPPAPPPPPPNCHHCMSLPCICPSPVLIQQWMYVPGPPMQFVPCAQPQPPPPPPPPPPPAPHQEKKPSHKCVKACSAEKKCAACKKAEDAKKKYYILPNFQNPRQTYRENVIAQKLYTAK